MLNIDSKSVIRATVSRPLSILSVAPFNRTTTVHVFERFIIASSRHVLPTQLPSFILPVSFPPSSIHVSTRPCFGSSSSYPKLRLTFNTSILTLIVASFLNATASLPNFNPSVNSPISHSVSPPFFLNASFCIFTSLFHRSLNSPNTFSPSTRSPNAILISFPALGINRGNCRDSRITS